MANGVISLPAVAGGAAVSDAALYQLQNGTFGVPLAFPTRTGPRCGHYESVTTPSGKQGVRFLRDPNALCGLPTKKSSVDACIANPNACPRAVLPSGWRQVGTSPVTPPNA